MGYSKLCPDVVGMVVSGWDPNQLNLLFVFTKTGQSLNSFAMFKKKMNILSLRIKGLKSYNADSRDNQKGTTGNY